jgi:uncharacterized protein
MLKYLLLAVAIIWLYYSPALRGLRGVQRPPPKNKAQAKPPTVESMVRCAHCGMHLPSGEALADAGGQTYCSDAHRQAGPASS